MSKMQNSKERMEKAASLKALGTASHLRGRVPLWLRLLRIARCHRRAHPHPPKPTLEGYGTAAPAGFSIGRVVTETRFQAVRLPHKYFFPHSQSSLLSFPSTQTVVVLLLGFVPWSLRLLLYTTITARQVATKTYTLSSYHRHQPMKQNLPTPLLADLQNQKNP